jgi:hypothetical protein
VEEAVAAVSYPLDRVEVEVFILPYPRRDALDSSTWTGRMFLSPGVYPLIREQQHYTVAHELGHAIHRTFMPDDTSALWQEFRELRRITDTGVYNNYGVHKNRPNEIFAEDFRFLFGGELANYCGSIENSDLPLPTEVPGLKEFFLSLPATLAVNDAAALIQLLTFPNPFNPVLNISFSVSEPESGVAAIGGGAVASAIAGASGLGSAPATRFGRTARLASAASFGQVGRHLRLSVFDVDGRVVSTLVDRDLQPGNYSAVWNGTDGRGTRVSSGVYFLKLEVGSESAVKKVILAR